MTRAIGQPQPRTVPPGGRYTGHVTYIYAFDIAYEMARLGGARGPGTLLGQPFLCAFITAPAVNAKVVLERSPSRGPAIRAAMRARIAKVLTIAAAHEHDALVLGAWGCGVFGNDPTEIATLFAQALHQQFAGVFAEVVFAILDWSPDAHFIGPFQRAFTP